MHIFDSTPIQNGGAHEGKENVKVAASSSLSSGRLQIHLSGEKSQRSGGDTLIRRRKDERTGFAVCFCCSENANLDKNFIKLFFPEGKQGQKKKRKLKIITIINNK